jgi:hypothetical protein
MLGFSRLFAAFVAATLMALTFAPARAAGIPASSALVLEQAGRVEAGQVQYWHHRYHGRPHYRHRVYHGRPVYRHRVYHSRPVYRHRVYRPAYYGAPVYVGRRCFNRVRWVRTPYGPVRRVVRVCRW